MARINVEATFLGDFRFRRLCKLLGDDDKALGMVVRFWIVAQKYWGEGRRLVPLEEFKNDGFEPLLKTGLAQKKSKGVYARGSENQFSWYLQRCRASKKGVIARKNNKNKKVTDVDSGQPELDFRSTENSFRLSKNRKPNNPPSPSPSPSLKNIRSKGAAVALSPKKELNHKVSLFIKAYVDAWQEKYKTKKRPDLSSKIIGQAGTFIKTRNLDEAIDLVQVYCQMDDQWFETKYHDLITFLGNINKIAMALDTGRKDPKKKSWTEEMEGRNGNEGVRETDRPS